MQQYHNNYNYSNFVVKFIEQNKKRLIKLNKFKHLSLDSDTNAFGEAMIIKKEDMINFKLPTNKKITIMRNQLCANAEAIKNIPYLNNNITPEQILMELTYNHENSIRKGAMSLTTCHSVTDQYNLGCNYNISLATTFIGSSDLLLGRIVLFRLKHNLNAYVFNLDNDYDRYLSELLYTKLILGNDYQLNVYQGVSNDPINNSNLGFTGCTHCLPQKVIYFYLDFYNETRYQHFLNMYQFNNSNKSFDEFYEEKNNDVDYPPHDAIFIPDMPTTSDEILQFPIKGTELRIYNAHRHIKVVGIYMDFCFYEDVESYKIYITKLLKRCKKKSIALIESLKKLINGESDENNISYLSDNNFDGCGLILNRLKRYKKTVYDILPNKDIDIILKNQTNFNNFLNMVYQKRISNLDFKQMCDDIKHFCEQKYRDIRVWGGIKIFRKRHNMY